MKKVMYTAVVLTPHSHDQLLLWWKETVGVPLHDKVLAHHMTIKFKPSEAEVSALPLGTEVRLQVLGYGADAKGQAIVVESLDVKSTNPHPHITVAVSAGVSPVYSNELLGRGPTHVSGPTLTGTIEAC